jgi:hypothetical protein
MVDWLCLKLVCGVSSGLVEMAPAVASAILLTMAVFLNTAGNITELYLASGEFTVVA